MPVSINTNGAATTARNNLAASYELLQKSLHRLSSGSKIVSPADDAGGLAVSMKLSAAARRQGSVASNIGNTVSYLQTQDSALASFAKILGRIGELKSLSQDPTKNALDLANYSTEFVALQGQLTGISQEKFNGINLFGSTSLALGVTESGNSSVSITGADIFATVSSPTFTTLSDTFANLSNWTNASTGGNISVASNYLTLSDGPGNGVDGVATSNASFSGPFELNVTFQSNSQKFDIRLGSTVLFDYTANSSTHSVRIVKDSSGNFSAYLDGSSTAYSSGSGAPASGTISLRSRGTTATFANTHLQNFSITSTSGSASNASNVATAGSLNGVSLSTITSALQEIATLRATNGGTQSRLMYSSDLLTTNKANLEAAVSRITDVDVAAESSTLARQNTLVQAGTSMLSQANQSSQIALRLIG